MHRFPIERHDAALADLEEIWFRIAIENRGAATRVIEAIDRRIQQLGNFPELGAARPDILPGLRMVVEGNYLILYHVTETSVVIVRVVHGARDLGDIF